MKMRLTAVLLLAYMASGCAGSGARSSQDSAATEQSVSHVDFGLVREPRRPGMACADSIRSLLEGMTRAQAFVLAKEPPAKDDAIFESFVIRSAIGFIDDADCASLIALLSDSGSYGEYMKTSVFLPDFGVRLLSDRDTLAVVLTFREDNAWGFRRGTRGYGGHFDPIAAEMRAFVARVAPDADIR